MFIRRTIILILAFAIAAVPSPAIEKDSVAVPLAMKEHLSPLAGLSSLARENPAVHVDAFRSDYSYAEAGYSMRREDKAFTVQDGKGEDYGFFKSGSFMRLSEKNSAWGYAGYRRGKKYDVRWNSTSDYSFIYPYATADSIGGNLASEEYRFGGGYGHRSGRWTWGLEGRLRAAHEYRDVNPRPRNIVTHIDIKAAGAFSPGRYRTCVSMGTEIYRQKSDVAFYGDKGVISEYFLSGLGAHYSRFKGNDNGTMFKGTTWKGAVSIIPDDQEKGLYLTIEYVYTSIRKTLVEKNNLPIQKSVPQTLKSEVAWEGGLSSEYVWGVAVKASYRFLSGYESITAENISNEYKSVGTLEMFQMETLKAGATGCFGQEKTRSCWYLTPSVNFTGKGEVYRFPSQSWKWMHISAGAGMLYRICMEKTAFSIAAEALWSNGMDKGLDIPSASIDRSMEAMLRQNHRMAVSDRIQGAISARTDMCLRGRLRIYIRAGYKAIVLTQGQAAGHTAEISCGINF